MLDQFVRDEEANPARHDAEELARSLLAEMPSVARVRFLTEQLLAVGHPAALDAMIEARNALTMHLGEMISDQMEREHR